MGDRCLRQEQGEGLGVVRQVQVLGGSPESGVRIVKSREAVSRLRVGGGTDLGAKVSEVSVRMRRGPSFEKAGQTWGLRLSGF